MERTDGRGYFIYFLVIEFVKDFFSSLACVNALGIFLLPVVLCLHIINSFMSALFFFLSLKHNKKMTSDIPHPFSQFSHVIFFFSWWCFGPSVTGVLCFYGVSCHHSSLPSHKDKRQSKHRHFTLRCSNQNNSSNFFPPYIYIIYKEIVCYTHLFFYYFVLCLTPAWREHLILKVVSIHFCVWWWFPDWRMMGEVGYHACLLIESRPAAASYFMTTKMLHNTASLRTCRALATIRL